MSQENLEVVRRALESLRWGPEGPTLEEIQNLVSEFWDPAGDYYPSRKFPESRPCHGREEIVRFFSGYYTAWERFKVEIKVLIPVGDNCVLGHITLSGEGRGSGVELNADLYQCTWLRNGRYLRGEDHFTPAVALRALGLDERGVEAAGLSE